MQRTASSFTDEQSPDRQIVGAGDTATRSDGGDHMGVFDIEHEADVGQLLLATAVIDVMHHEDLGLGYVFANR